MNLGNIGAGKFGVPKGNVVVPFLPPLPGPNDVELGGAVGPGAHPSLPFALPPRDKTKPCVDTCHPKLALQPIPSTIRQLPARTAATALDWQPVTVDRPTIVSIRTGLLRGPLLAWAGEDRPVTDQLTDGLLRSGIDCLLPHGGVWWLAYDATNGSAALTVALLDAYGTGENSTYRRNGFSRWTYAVVNVAAATLVLAANPNRRWARIASATRAADVLDDRGCCSIAPDNAANFAQGIILSPYRANVPAALGALNHTAPNEVVFSETSPHGLWLGDLWGQANVGTCDVSVQEGSS